MWGNKLGWGISAVMAVLCIGLVGSAWVATNVTTPPTEFTSKDENLATIELPVSPRTILENMIGPEDAAPLYRQAINDYKNHLMPYELLTSSIATTGQIDLKEANKLAAFPLLLQATSSAQANLFSNNPAEVIRYTNKDSIDTLDKLGNICAFVGKAYQKQKNYAEAQKYYEAIFSMGAKLFQERLCKMEMSTGLYLMDGSAKLMRAMAYEQKDTPRFEKLTKFIDTLAEYQEQRIDPVDRVVTSIDQKVLEKHVGDVFRIAKASRERTWQIEAILKLGTYKHNAGRPGDVRAARRTLKELMTSTDPFIKTAATAASKLTLEDYRMMK